MKKTLLVMALGLLAGCSFFGSKTAQIASWPEEPKSANRAPAAEFQNMTRSEELPTRVVEALLAIVSTTPGVVKTEIGMPGEYTLELSAKAGRISCVRRLQDASHNVFQKGCWLYWDDPQPDAK